MFNSKNFIIIFLSILVIALLGFIFFQNKTITVIDRAEDEVVEELSTEEVMQSLLAQKYNKPLNEVKTHVIKEDATHVAGSVMFGEGGPGAGGLVLMVKEGETWKLIYDGNGSVNCNELRQKYGFSNEILRPNFCD